MSPDVNIRSRVVCVSTNDALIDALQLTTKYGRPDVEVVSFKEPDAVEICDTIEQGDTPLRRVAVIHTSLDREHPGSIDDAQNVIDAIRQSVQRKVHIIAVRTDNAYGLPQGANKIVDLLAADKNTYRKAIDKAVSNS